MYTPNPILNTDSYKLSHWKQYPPGTKRVSSYVEARGVDSNLFGIRTEIVHFGLQYFIKEYLMRPTTMRDIDEATAIAEKHGVPFNREGWLYILRNHAGFMPVRITGLPEGTVVEKGTVQAQIENLDEETFWVTSYIETALLRAIWYPSTVATMSREIKKVIAKYNAMTADNALLDFQLHDFGARGSSCFESSLLAGAAHLVNFTGTDTIHALPFIDRYYDGDPEKSYGLSIPASEHSTMTAWGREREKEAYENMVDIYGGEGRIVSVVSDSYDIYNAISEIWGNQLLEKVKTHGGTVVIRPDSGDPILTVQKCLMLMEEKFGVTTNSKGFKVLPPYVRIIQGDGINIKSIDEILKMMQNLGFSSENIVFGMGGALHQKLNRDTLKYSMKCNAIYRNGVWQDVYKSPTDASWKNSKPGRQAVINVNGRLLSIAKEETQPHEKDHLQVVYDRGIPREGMFSTFDEVKERAKI